MLIPKSDRKLIHEVSCYFCVCPSGIVCRTMFTGTAAMDHECHEDDDDNRDTEISSSHILRKCMQVHKPSLRLAQTGAAGRDGLGDRQIFGDDLLRSRHNASQMCTNQFSTMHAN